MNSQTTSKTSKRVRHEIRVIRFNGLKLCSKLFFNYFQNKNGIRIKIQVDDLFLSHPTVDHYMMAKSYLNIHVVHHLLILCMTLFKA